MSLYVLPALYLQVVVRESVRTARALVRESLGLLSRYSLTQTVEPSHPSSDSFAQFTRTGPKGPPSPVLLNLGD